MNCARYTLNELLVSLFNLILSLEERNLKKSGVTLTMNDVHIIENIKKIKGNTMTQLANKLMVTQGTLTTNVNKLIKKGYVTRIKDEKDKRIVRLEITEKAEKVMAIHDAFHADMIDKAIGDLGLQENQVLNDSLYNIMVYFRKEYENLHKTD